MKCFHCDSNHVNIRLYTMKELKKNSPKRGKNKEYVDVKVKHYTCMSCQSQSAEYQ